MTEQQQRAASAQLAQRMGYTVAQYDLIGGGTRWKLIFPDGKAIRGSHSEASAWEDAPDYFTDADASRELVAWLDKESRPGGVIKNGLMVRDEFINHLLQVRGLSKYEVDDFFVAMTAPLPVIARAACKALGIEVSE